MLAFFCRRWRGGAPGCIDASALALAVERALGRAVFHPATRPTAIVEGGIDADPTGGFHATMTMLGASGGVLARREIATAAATCDRLDESVSVVVALMVDSLQSAPVTLQLPPRPARVESPRRSGSGSVSADAGAGISFGVLLGAAATAYLRAEVGLTAPPWPANEPVIRLVAVDDTYLYWSSFSEITRVPKCCFP